MRPMRAHEAPSFVHGAMDAAMEAAPARARVRAVALAVFAMLLLLAGRATQLAFAGDPLSGPRAGAAASQIARADLLDRNGVLLATTVRAYVLTAIPARVWNAEETADALRTMFPGLDRATLVRRLTDRSRDAVYLRRGLSEEERARVLALGLAGVGFEPEDKRVYPNGALAGHVLGFTDVDLKPLAGVERGLDREIRAAAAGGRALKLSLDVRVQYALETELSRAADAANASGASGVIMNARSGEILALASWPAFDPNAAGAANDNARRNRAAGDLHELGSTIKPFTLAMAIEDQRVAPSELFDLSQPFELSGIEDHEPMPPMSSLRDILVHSSNIGAARLALRVGGERQRFYLDRLGLTQALRLQSGTGPHPRAPIAQGRRDVASRGFGYGLATSQVALASAYTVFAHGGARVAPTLGLTDPDAAPAAAPVFSAQTASQVLGYMRAVVTSGTGRAADVPGLDVAGKTGTAEKLADGQGYDEGRNFSSFAGVFPARDPRYVIVVALDDTEEGAVGGMVAAPAVAATLRRVAPMLGLRVSPH